MKLKSHKLYIVSILIVFAVLKVNAQLGFCNGNSGDPIFTEDFGVALSAVTEHIPLPAPGQTTYTFLGSPPTVFSDGKYTVTNLNYQQWNWFNTEDHTPGDTNGRMLIVNAAFVQGEFYRLPITGLCENTTYEFSSWLMNLTPRNLTNGGNTPNPCNVSFEIWDSTNTTLVKSGSTGNFLGSLSTENGEWLEFGLVFQTPPGQTSVILKMVNNGVGGYGNDVAIDDIVFKSCGDFILVEDTGNNNNIIICSSQTPYSTTISAVPDGSVFTTHFYQWQESSDGVTWVDVPGQTNQSLSISGVTNTTYFRSKVSESVANLNNSLCNTVSDVFQITVNQALSMPIIECWETATFNDTTCAWEITGTQPAAPTGLECWEINTWDVATCAWITSGTQPVEPTGLECWETNTWDLATCAWITSGTQPAEPTGLECWEINTWDVATCAWITSGIQPAEPISLECWETTTFNDTTCLWEVTGTQSAAPVVACWETTTFNSTTCLWDVSGTQTVGVYDEDFYICNGASLFLDASTSIPNPEYIWNTGDTTDFIEVDSPGLYSVEITSSTSCVFETRNFNIIEAENPLIEKVETDGNNIVVETINSGNFLYSLDGIIFQTSNVFSNVDGGLYTIYVKNQYCSNTVNQPHLHFYIPKFFTPNNDGENDTFKISGMENFSSWYISIYDRFGKLLKNSSNSQFSWDGTYNGQPMYSGDYWYVIVIDNQKFTGHFTLKR